jgi:hypothetical protein
LRPPNDIDRCSFKVISLFVIFFTFTVPNRVLNEKRVSRIQEWARREGKGGMLPFFGDSIIRTV